MKKLLFLCLLFANLLAANPTNFSKQQDSPDGICANCATPTGLAVANTTGTTADLSWTAGADNVSYTVVVENGKNNLNQFSWTTTTTQTTVTVTGLTPGLNYKFKVRATCSNGKKSGWAKWFQFNSSSAEPCNTPTGLAATPTGIGSADLGWGAVAGAGAYLVNVQDASGNPNDYNQNFTVTTNSLSVSGLVGGFNYKFKVRSQCFGGNLTSWSPYFTFSTPAAKPSNTIEQIADSRNETLSNETFGIQISPNPIQGQQANLLILGAGGKNVQVQIFDFAGRVVLSENVAPEGSEWVQALALPELSRGMYVLKVQTEKESRSMQILVNE